MLTGKQVKIHMDNIDYRVQYVKGMYRYLGNGGAVDKNMREIEDSVTALADHVAELSKYVDQIQTIIATERTNRKEMMTKKDN
jgi:uncharacterized membrane protein YdfJ with MMPL/SSD domain